MSGSQEVALIKWCCIRASCM